MSETALKIRLFGESVLRKKAAQVRRVAKIHQDILSQMSRLMYEESGVGLAAPQAGISEAMIVVDVGSGLYKLINPKIVSKKGSQSMEEGCLSLPGVSIKVKRAKKIKVKALNENSEPVNIDVEGLLACVFQHEIDHLNGKLIIDYASFFERLTLKKKLEEIRKRTVYEELPEPKAKSYKL